MQRQITNHSAFDTSVDQATDLTIDEILGVDAIDKNDYIRRENSFSAFGGNSGFINRNKFSHSHPFGSVSINKMRFFQIFTIIANYDLDRKTSGDNYLQSERDVKNIEFLVNELAFQGLCILAGKVPTNVPDMSDLAVLQSTIDKSEYLASYEGMQQLSKLAIQRWLEMFNGRNKKDQDSECMRIKRI